MTCRHVYCDPQPLRPTRAISSPNNQDKMRTAFDPQSQSHKRSRGSACWHLQRGARTAAATNGPANSAPIDLLFVVKFPCDLNAVIYFEALQSRMVGVRTCQRSWSERGLSLRESVPRTVGSSVIVASQIGIIIKSVHVSVP